MNEEAEMPIIKTHFWIYNQINICCINNSNVLPHCALSNPSIWLVLSAKRPKWA